MVELTRSAPTMMDTEWLKSLPPARRYAFYGDAPARAAAEAAWGVPFSDDACRAISRDSRATLWLGPDEYLLLDFAGGDPGAAHAAAGDSQAHHAAACDPDLSRALTGISHALVDVSHRQFALEVSGPHADTILNGACPLDLDLAEFPIGMCTRTVFAKAEIVLWRTRRDAFHVEVWRSFSGYVTGVLTEIAAEFYPR